jgi:signal transduction histidine kinase/FixJ family two-component response regulator
LAAVPADPTNFGAAAPTQESEPVAEPHEPTDSVPASRPSPTRLFLRQHLVALVVLVALLAVTTLTTIALHRVVDNQEERLLSERTSELGAFLSSSANDSRSTLTSIGSAVVYQGPKSPLFAGGAAALTATGAGVVVAQRPAKAFVSVASVGNGAPAPGAAITGPAARLVQRAIAGNDLVTDVVSTSGGSRLLVALKIPGGRGPATVAYLDQPLTPSRPAPTNSSSPYRELNVALYAATTPDAKRLVIVSGTTPRASAHPVQRTVPVGQDKWLVVVSARESLVGNFAPTMPWLVFGGGVALAVLLTVLIEVLSRRREYALKLVEQRTRALWQAQAAAEAANRSKSDFLSRMSHELRTPLNAVLGFGQLLELDDLNPDQRQAVTQITKGGRHLLDLINEILDITQIETGQLSLSPEAVLVSDLLTDTVELVAPLAEERSVHLLSADGPACQKFIFVDRQRVKQILLNLLGNGIKYNRQGGTVSISCAEAEKGRMRIQVTDTGPGIPQEQFGLLFTPFERLGAEQTTVQGTGIGLALSRRLAEIMGGTLDVESTVGRGSTFWVEFPLVEGPVQRYERLDDVAAALPSGVQQPTGPAILHIEDNLSNISLIERVLAQRPGVRLIPAMQGRLGIELARQHQPVLILLDLNLADLPGEEVLQSLRDDPLTAGIPVAIVSADAMPRQIQRLLSTGATAYLTKPIDVKELLLLIDNALAARTEAVDLVSQQAEPGQAHATTAGDHETVVD